MVRFAVNCDGVMEGEDDVHGVMVRPSEPGLSAITPIAVVF